MEIDKYENLNGEKESISIYPKIKAIKYLKRLQIGS